MAMAGPYGNLNLRTEGIQPPPILQGNTGFLFFLFFFLYIIIIIIIIMIIIMEYSNIIGGEVRDTREQILRFGGELKGEAIAVSVFLNNSYSGN